MALNNFCRSSKRNGMSKIYMFEPPVRGEFINFNAASVRTLEKLFTALIFWFFLIKQKEQERNGENFGHR
jgi:hypothetical protein